MLDNESLEQPSALQETQVADANEIFEVSESKDEGSTLGKFKSPEALLEAYENLQKEFTRKSQRLSSLEKEHAENKTESAKVDEAKPAYLQENWDEKVADFLAKNQNAKKHAKEISKIIFESEDIAKSDKALELAYAKILEQNYVEPQTLAKNETFLSEYILSDSDIKKQVLSIYLDELQKNTVPPVMLKSGGMTATPTQIKKAGNLEEAKSLVSALFGE